MILFWPASVENALWRECYQRCIIAAVTVEFIALLTLILINFTGGDFYEIDSDEKVGMQTSVCLWQQ